MNKLNFLYSSLQHFSNNSIPRLQSRYFYRIVESVGTQRCDHQSPNFSIDRCALHETVLSTYSSIIWLICVWMASAAHSVQLKNNINQLESNGSNLEQKRVWNVQLWEDLWRRLTDTEFHFDRSTCRSDRNWVTNIIILNMSTHYPW